MEEPFTVQTMKITCKVNKITVAVRMLYVFDSNVTSTTIVMSVHGL